MNIHFSITLGIAMTFCLGAPAHAESVNPNAPINPTDFHSPVKVACVGDSITQGAGASKGMSYPSQLQTLLGDQWTVGNFGVSGRTLMRSGDHPYWKETAYQRALKFDPDVVIIMLGTNDTKAKNWSHKEEFETDYRDLVKSFQALRSHPRIFLCRPVPVPEPGNYGIKEAGIQEQIPIVNKLVAEMHTGIIDMHAAFDGKFALLPDHVHPNNDGAEVMANTAYQVLVGHAPAKVESSH